MLIIFRPNVNLKAQPQGAKVDQFVKEVSMGKAGAKGIHAQSFPPPQRLLYSVPLCVEDAQLAEDGNRLGKVGHADAGRSTEGGVFEGVFGVKLWGASSDAVDAVRMGSVGWI